MPRPLVVEGPDGAGKSTLIQCLNREFPWSSVMHTGGPKTAEECYSMLATTERISKEGFWIFDRVPQISERIYAPLDNRLAAPAPTLQASLLRLNPVVIYCRLKDVQQMFEFISTEKKAHKPPEHLKKVKEGFPRLIRAYDTLMETEVSPHLPVVGYDWTQDSYTALLKLIQTYMEAK